MDSETGQKTDIRQEGETYIRPDFVEVTPTNVKGEATNRLQIVLRSGGCQYALRPEGGCTFCGFTDDIMKRGSPVGMEDLIRQFSAAFKAHDCATEGIRDVNVYVAGSFFSDKEFPPEARYEIARLVSDDSYVKSMLVESRPEFVTSEKVGALKKILGEKILQVGIGLETADDDLRQRVLKKGFSNADYERAVEVLSVAGAEVLTYVLLKPTVMTDVEAVADAVEAVRYSFRVAKEADIRNCVSLNPTFVPLTGELYQQWKRGEYRPPNLWGVVEVLRQTHDLGQIRVGLSDENLGGEGRVAENCKKCTALVRRAIEQFNITQNIGVFDGLDCECRKLG